MADLKKNLKNIKGDRILPLSTYDQIKNTTNEGISLEDDISSILSQIDEVERKVDKVPTDVYTKSEVYSKSETYTKEETLTAISNRIKSSKTDLQDGVSQLATGTIYLVYD